MLPHQPKKQMTNVLFNKERQSSGGLEFFNGGNAPRSSVSGSMNSANTLRSATDFENEPPLLEELGINFQNIGRETAYVLFPRKQVDVSVLADGDMTGPLIFCLILGFCLLLTGKLHFGYIYGYGLVGCVIMNGILNLMSDTGIDMLRTASCLGYCILPIVLLSVLNVFVTLSGTFGFCCSCTAVCWCAITQLVLSRI
eukprot:397553_1